MSASYRYSHAYPPPDTSSSLERLFASAKGAWIAAGIAILYLAYTSSLPSILVHHLWNVLVLLTPTTLILAVDKRRNPTLYDGSNSPQSSSDNHTFKSEAMRRVFGLGSASASILPGANSLRRASWLGGLTSPSDAPPGLGNWDNSCYQNSVLQGLSALQSLTTYLERSDVANAEDTSTTVGSMRELMAKLNDVSNNGRRIWTPAKLKSMSSFQQQDAQEYFSKIMDDMEKETTKAFKAAPGTAGLQEVESLNTIKASDSNVQDHRRNPLDGYLAQRVACTSCGFSEGLSLIPFNCVTVPLGRDYSYRIEDCLNDYTNLEEITGVECARCTLLRTRSQLQHMTAGHAENTDPSTSSPTSLPPDLRDKIFERLQAVEQALEEADVSDETLNKKCQIPRKARVSSTKTRQAVIARPPQCLVIHVNRSVFDEYTGAQSKNLANVTYPKVLNLGPWCLGTTQNPKDQEQWRMNPSKSMIGCSGRDSRSDYVLRAAVTHYGRHENGHYICYREHPEHAQATEAGDTTKHAPMKWWRLSDDDVSAVSEDHVLGQGGVFMLFYERIEVAAALEQPSNIVQEMQPEETTTDATINVQSDTSSDQIEVEAEKEETLPQAVVKPLPELDEDEAPSLPSGVRKLSTPQKMRTARNKNRRRSSGFSSTLQAVAAI